MKTVTISRPGHPDAAVWLKRYLRYKQADPRVRRLMRANWEWDRVAVLSVGLMLVFCVNPNPWWIYVPLLATVSIYLGWTWDRDPKVDRYYKRLLQRGDIIVVPEFVVQVCAKATETYGGLSDWDGYLGRRYELLAEASKLPGMAELRNDCGCRQACGHVNRLSRRNRDRLRLGVRRFVGREVEMMHLAHTGALEANKLRNDGIRRMLDSGTEDD